MIQRLTYILSAIFLFSGLLSCKKDVVEIPPSNNPVFYVNGTIGEDSVSFISGENNSLYSCNVSNENGINFFQGELVSDNLKINIGFYQGDNDLEKIKLDTILNKSHFNYVDISNQSLFYLKKDFFENQSKIKEIKWYLDGEYVGMNALSLYQPGKFNLCAHVTFMDLTSSEICNEILIGYKKNAIFSLRHYFTPENKLLTWIDASLGQVSSVNWYIDDVFYGHNLSLETAIDSNMHIIRADIDFINGVKRTRRILVDGAGLERDFDDFALLENFSQKSSDYKLKCDITIDGKVYSSSLTENNNAELKVNSISFYKFDENNNPIYLVKGILNGQVLTKTGNETKDINLNVSWGVVIK